MARVCTICFHPERLAIEAAITEGKPYRYLSLQYGVGIMALSRHKEHIAEAIQETQKAQDVQTAITVLGDLAWARDEAKDLYQKARDADDFRTASQVLDGFVRQTKLRAELTGELDQRTQINIQQTPDWQEMRSAFLQALSDLPEAKARVLRVMEVRSA